MIYIVQVILYTGVLWLLYMILLRDGSMHKFNRAYLLMATVLPFVIPFITLPEQTIRRVVNVTDLGVQLPEVVVNTNARQAVSIGVNWILTAYGTIALLMLLWMAVKWIKLTRLATRSKSLQHKGYTILFRTGYGPGSWGKYIFLPEGMVDDAIIKHELAHIQLKHTADIVWISILQCLCWPNLFLQAIKKELKQIHEYQADVAAGIDKQAYQQLLVASLFNTCTLPFTHSFIIHPVKRRIKMLNKKINPNKGRIAAMGAVLLTGALAFNMIALQSCKRKQWAADKNVTDSRTTYADPHTTYTDTNGNKRYAAEMPEFDRNVMGFIGKNIVYPEYAKKNKIEGRVMVRVLVDTQGNILEKEITQSPDASLSQAVIDMVNKMPKWKTNMQKGKPGTEYFLPVLFKLDNHAKGKVAMLTDDDKKKGATKDGYEASAKKMFSYYDEEMRKADKEMEKADREMEAADKEMEKADREMEKADKELEKMERELEKLGKELDEKFSFKA